MFSMVGGVVQW